MFDKITWLDKPHILKRLLELDAQETVTQPEMAIIIYREFPEDFLTVPTRDQVKNALASAREKSEYLADLPIAQIMPYYSKYESIIQGDETVEKDTATLQSILSKSKRKVCVISDLHIPFSDEEKLQKAIDLNRSADILVIAGDVLEMYGTSKWRKRKYVPHFTELDNGVRVLEYLSKLFPIIYVLRGNHDARPMKKVFDILPAELYYLLKSEDTLGMLIRPFSNVFYVDDWVFQIGDALIAHAERSSAIDGKPPVLTAEFFLHKGWAKRMSMGEIRLIVQAHTHQISSMYREDLKMMECGAMCQTLEYTYDPSASMRPPQNGFVSITQYNGITNFNETREFLL